MAFFNDFKFGNPSTAYGDICDIHYRENQAPVHRHQVKPVTMFYTHGMQVVGVPQQLIRILGVDTIRKAKGIRFIASAHFEMDNAFYLLRIENVVHMALPPQTR